MLERGLQFTKRRSRSKPNGARPARQRGASSAKSRMSPAQAGRSRPRTNNARSHFHRPRRPPRRPLSSGQAEERADRHGAAPAPAIRRHHEPPDRLPVLLRLRASRVLGAALQFPRRRPQPGFVRSRHRRTVRCRLRARLGADHQSGSARLLGRGLFVRRLDRHAAPDAPARGRGLHLDRAARQPLRLLVPRALPVLGPDRAWREGCRGAAEGRQHAGRES